MRASFILVAVVVIVGVADIFGNDGRATVAIGDGAVGLARDFRSGVSGLMQRFGP